MKLPAKIYVLRNTANGKCYVGRSADPEKRYQSHMGHLRRGTHPVEDMQKDFDLYGECFCFEILDTITDFADRALEYEWQDRLNTCDRRYGYNYKEPEPKTDTKTRLLRVIDGMSEKEIEYAYHLLSRLFGRPERRRRADK